MSQQLDKNLIRDSISKAKSGEILHLTCNAADPASVKAVIADIQKFIAKGVCTVTVVRK
jgi:TusA-related sulfurtransferase